MRKRRRNDWHSTQNHEYLKLCEARLNEPPLKWCKHFAEIINVELQKQSIPYSLRIKDIGCNVGHFARVLNELSHDNVKYSGIDISETYLRIAIEHFPKHKFHELDFSDCRLNVAPFMSEVTVMSATLEHVSDYEMMLRNILRSTIQFVVMRTFIGDIFLQEYCRKPGADRSYLISQFTFDEIRLIASNEDFTLKIIRDEATLGASKTVCSTPVIVRNQSVVVLSRNSP